MSIFEYLKVFFQGKWIGEHIFLRTIILNFLYDGFDVSAGLAYFLGAGLCAGLAKVKVSVISGVTLEEGENF